MPRWYDKNPKLKKNLDSMTGVHPARREVLIKGMIQLMRAHHSKVSITESSVFLGDKLHRRRWYDRDPYVWVAFHSLKTAAPKLQDMVAEYLNNQ